MFVCLFVGITHISSFDGVFVNIIDSTLQNVDFLDMVFTCLDPV